MDTRASGRIAEEQDALRRVAMLAARAAPPEEVFAAVAAEAGRLLGADRAAMARYDFPDSAMTTVALWSAVGDVQETGRRTPLGGRNVSTLVLETGQPARIDDFSQASGPAADIARERGYRSGVGAPITVEGRLWGVLTVASTRAELLPTDTEARLVGFTELLGTAIANAQSRVELREYAEEQAALRRVATLVAQAAPPEEVFVAVSEEIGRVLSADFASMTRYDADDTATMVGMWTRADIPWPIALGDQWSLGGRNLATLVHQTGQPARIVDYSKASGALTQVAHSWGLRAGVGVPITVVGRLWGVAVVGSMRKAFLPADTEARLAEFTELVGTAIANAEAQAALAASRARIVTAADEAQRRIERDLHDGAQQRLVTLALLLREAQAMAPPAAAELVTRLDGVADGLVAALEDLREIARGIHPAALADGGLPPALTALARRSPVPVDLRVQVAGRLAGPVEIAAYYVVSEALANIAKHAGATAATVTVATSEGALRVSVRDDGRGGAAFGRGSGLVGLRDRAEALGGRITLHSPSDAGTTLEVNLPLEEGSRSPHLGDRASPRCPLASLTARHTAVGPLTRQERTRRRPIMTKKLRWAALAAAVAAATTIGLASAGSAASAGTATGNHTARPASGSIASNERVVRSFLQTVLDEHQANRAASFMTSNVQWSGGTVGTIKGRSNVAGLFAGVVAALPNAHASVKDIFGQGDQVLVRLVVSGTQKGAILGIPASGRNVHWNALDVFILKDGKISAIWAGDDWTAILYYTGTYKAPWIP